MNDMVWHINMNVQKNDINESDSVKGKQKKNV